MWFVIRIIGCYIFFECFALYIYIRQIYFSLLCKIVNPLSIVPVPKTMFFSIEANSLSNRRRMGMHRLLCRQHMDMLHKLRCRRHMGLQQYGLQHLLLCRRRCKLLGCMRIVVQRRQLPRRRGRLRLMPAGITEGVCFY